MKVSKARIGMVSHIKIGTHGRCSKKCPYMVDTISYYPLRQDANTRVNHRKSCSLFNNVSNNELLNKSSDGGWLRHEQCIKCELPPDSKTVTISQDSIVLVPKDVKELWNIFNKIIDDVVGEEVELRNETSPMGLGYHYAHVMGKYTEYFRKLNELLNQDNEKD